MQSPERQIALKPLQLVLAPPFAASPLVAVDMEREPKQAGLLQVVRRHDDVEVAVGVEVQEERLRN